MIVLLPCISLLNLSWITKMSFLRNMEPLRTVENYPRTITNFKPAAVILILNTFFKEDHHIVLLSERFVLFLKCSVLSKILCGIQE